jgi:hypothetical protein
MPSEHNDSVELGAAGVKIMQNPFGGVWAQPHPELEG